LIIGLNSQIVINNKIKVSFSPHKIHHSSKIY